MMEGTLRDRHPVHEELGGYEGSKLAMWLFLATELLLFGVLFAAFAIFHGMYAAEFKLAHNTLDKMMGGINTIVLICSSLSVALALDAVQRGKRSRANWLLLLTILLAGVFLVVKYFEYTGKFAHGIFPGRADQIVIDAKNHIYGPVPAGMQQAGINVFFSFYFLMTGVHGLHVIIGMTVLGIVLYKNMNGRYSHWYYTPVENGALYWHLVDLIWIYLFPLFYLVS